MELLPLKKIDPNPDQPRKLFDAGALEELASSIEENGLLQPITVTKKPRGRYQIVAGERRWRAHQLLVERGAKPFILAIVRPYSAEEVAINAIVENDVRQDTTPMEQARAYQRMIDQFGYDAQSLAKKLGKPAFRIEERLRLLAMTAECQFLFEKGQLTAEQVWYLSTLSTTGQSRMLRAINAGQCPTTTALKAVRDAIAAAEAQVAMFDGEADRQPLSEDDVKAARGFEAKVEQLAAMLRDGIQDNVVTAVGRVNPSRCGTLADLFAAMQKDLARIETALRVASLQEIAA
jgi:ParB family chromosome partitioning protein